MAKKKKGKSGYGTKGRSGGDIGGGMKSPSFQTNAGGIPSRVGGGTIRPASSGITKSKRGG